MPERAGEIVDIIVSGPLEGHEGVIFSQASAVVQTCKNVILPF